MTFKQETKLTPLGKKIEKLHREMQAARTGGPNVRVGILQSEFKSQHKSETKEQASIGEVALFNEFGTKRIPERPFIRGSYQKYIKAWRKLIHEQVDLAYQGKKDLDTILKLVGLKIQADMKRFVVELKSPPNAPVTAERKKSNNPLIHTGQMINSIHFQINVED